MNVYASDDLKIDISGINFSSKEEAVIREFLTGVPYKVIASNLNISPSAIEYHIRNIMNKTGCKTKVELMTFLKEKIPQGDEAWGKVGKSFKQKALILIITTAIVAGFIFLKFRPCKTMADIELPQFQENMLPRTKVISKAMELLERQNGIRMLAIAGEGGAGKTLMGRKILSQYKTSIRWEINAETSDSAYNSFLDLANRLARSDEDIKELEKINKLQFFDEKRKRLMNFLSHFFQRASEWCLLFDNVDTVESVRPYIFQNTDVFGSGSIIITTRDTDIGDVDFIKSSNVINIGHLSELEQRKLFCDILYRKDFNELNEYTQTKVQKFLEKIPKMPLDVVAAAYYLKNTKISFEDYEEIMQNSYRDLIGMQERLLEKNVNYNRTRYGIVSSVFEDVLSKRSDFKILLLTLCLLDSQNLPKRIMKMVAGGGLTDEFLYDLRRHSLIVDSGDSVSIHRSSQSIGLDYVLTVLSTDERNRMINHLCAVLTPYENLEKNFEDLNKLIPHLKAFLKKLNELSKEEFRQCKIDLSLVIGDIYRHRTYQLQNALKYFKDALKMEEGEAAEASLGKILFKAGEVCTIIGRNDEAISYLNKSVSLLNEDHLPEFVRNHSLIGVIQMRKGCFQEANKYFEKALNILDSALCNDSKLQLVKADTYSDMAFNYFMNGINRKDAQTALGLMQKAIAIISLIDVGNDSAMKLQISAKLAVYQSRLSGIYNALGKYDFSLKMADEAQKIINEIGTENTNIFYAQGVIARERGLANLRLNNISEAYDYFMQAKEILTKSSVNEYLFRLKMHEAECLVRLNRLDEAFRACAEIFSIKDRERNNYCDLFYNTCFYHAAVICFKKGDKLAAQKYFRKFFENMETLCKNILEARQYNELCRLSAFKCDDISECFINSLKIFEAIYWNDYEFIKYYVRTNIDLIR